MPSRDFNGSTAFITVPDIAPNAAGISVAAWVKADVFGGFKGICGQANFVTSDFANSSWLLQYNPTDGFQFGINSPGSGAGFASVNVGSAASLGVWYHLCGTYDATTIRFYVNGTAVGTPNTTLSGTPFNSTLSIFVGANRGSGAAVEFWDGMICDVAIFPRGLSSAEVTDLMTDGPPEVWSGGAPSCWLPCDGFLSPEPDFSGNGNHGVLTGTTQGTQPPSLNTNWPYPIAAGAEGSAASGNITLGAPAPTGGNASGDVWMAVVHSADQVAHTLTDWTQVFQANGGGTTSRLSVWEFRYTGSTPNLVVTHAAGGPIVGGIVACRGGAASGSIVAAQGAGGAGIDTTIELATVTPGVLNTLLLACDGSAAANARTPFTGAYPMFNEGGANNLSITGSSVAALLKFWQTGASGGLVDTQAGAGTAWASVLMALKATSVAPLYTQVAYRWRASTGSLYAPP